jgi:hypothetical protein
LATCRGRREGLGLCRAFFYPGTWNAQTGEGRGFRLGCLVLSCFFFSLLLHLLAFRRVSSGGPTGLASPGSGDGLSLPSLLLCLGYK